MSDLRPSGIPVKICGREYNFLFTIGIIENLQEECNKALVEIIAGIARISNYSTKPEDLRCFNETIAAFVSADTGKKIAAEELDGVIKPAEMQKIAVKILEAYGFAMPEPDEEEDIEEEDEDPNQKTGQ